MIVPRVFLLFWFKEQVKTVLGSRKFIALSFLLILGFLEVPIFYIPVEVVYLYFAASLTSGFAYVLIYQALTSRGPVSFRAVSIVVAGLFLLMGMLTMAAVFQAYRS